MSGFRLLSLGVGDAFSALYYFSCFVLEAEGHWLLIDSPHPIRKIWREGTLAAGLTMGIDRIEAMVLTHLHGDHVSGLESLAFYFRFILGRKLTVITHPEVAGPLWSQHLAGSMEWSIQEVGQAPLHRNLEDYVDVVAIESASRPSTIFPPSDSKSRPPAARLVTAQTRRFIRRSSTGWPQPT
jgi:glyoxylase-like metal-dependent hydrolase (beta-lactamase superfamily II)